MRPLRRTTVGLAAAVALATVSQAAYTVRPGDTLSGIASRLGVTVRALTDANGIDDPDRIRAGQELQVPGAAPVAPVTAASGGTTYTVKAGDALSRIASRHGVTLAAIGSANAITDPNRIRIGQVLAIPTGVTRAPAPGPVARPGRAPDTVGREEAGRIITEVAREYGWSPSFVKALAWQESGWQMTRISSTGAVGFMQVMPGTGAFVAKRLVGRPLDLADPRDNVTAGVAFLDYLYDLTGGDAEMTLAGYYQGLASVRRNGMYVDTERYIANVLALRSRF